METRKTGFRDAFQNIVECTGKGILQIGSNMPARKVALHREIDGKRGTGALFAFNINTAAHQFGKLLAD